jgi:hypothetical protein
MASRSKPTPAAAAAFRLGQSARQRGDARSSITFERPFTVAPSLPQRLQRIRGPKDGTAALSGQPSILTARSGRSACRSGTGH